MDGKELEGLKCHQVIHGLSEPLDECPLIRSLESKKREEVEFYSKKWDMTFHIRTDPLFDDDGNIEKFVHQQIDIDEA